MYIALSELWGSGGGDGIVADGVGVVGDGVVGDGVGGVGVRVVVAGDFGDG